MRAPCAALLLASLAAPACVQTPPAATPQSRVWVCHGGRNARWQRVAAAAADAHRRHGDVVSETPQRERAPCP